MFGTKICLVKSLPKSWSKKLHYIYPKSSQFEIDLDVSKNRSTPKWMVYNGKLIKMDDLGPHYFRKPPYTLKVVNLKLILNSTFSLEVFFQYDQCANPGAPQKLHLYPPETRFSIWQSWKPQNLQQKFSGF